MSGVTDQKQYDRLAQDWRELNNIMWGIPSIAVSIFTGIIVVAYQPDLAGWARIIVLGVGSIFLFAVTVEIIKKRLLMSATSARLHRLEQKSLGPFPSDTEQKSLGPFPSDTPGLLEEVDNNLKESKVKNPEATNPDDKDPVYLLFRRSYARQYLGHVVFAAAILTSILTYWEFIKYQNYESWSYLAGISPVVVISVAFVILKLHIIKRLKEWVKNRKKVKQNKV
jgi:cell division protein FtsW (lipid II flippase)